MAGWNDIIHSNLVLAEKGESLDLDIVSQARKHTTELKLMILVYNIFLRRRNLIHRYQLLHPHVMGSMPFRFTYQDNSPGGQLPRGRLPPDDSPAGRLPRRTTPPQDDSPEDDSPAGRLPRRTTPRRTTPPQDVSPGGQLPAGRIPRR